MASLEEFLEKIEQFEAGFRESLQFGVIRCPRTHQIEIENGCLKNPGPTVYKNDFVQFVNTDQAYRFIDNLAAIADKPYLILGPAGTVESRAWVQVTNNAKIPKDGKHVFGIKQFNAAGQYEKAGICGAGNAPEMVVGG